MPTFLHIDINSYFATMLQQKYPHLRGQPVGIIKDTGRTCIIAASKEAKKLGVDTGSNVADAKKHAPDIRLMPAEFDYYLDSTKRLKRLFESISPDVEIFSLDEAFVNITPCLKYLYPDPRVLSRHIQTQIKHQLGEWVTCNIGISHNRFLAKLASEVSPKGSVTRITPQTQDHFLASAPFADVCGIGYRLEKKLRQLRVTNPYQINFLTDQTLEANFGPFLSKQLRRMGQGQEPHLFNFINHLNYAKSVGRSITGFRLHTKPADIKAVIYNLISEVIYKTRSMRLAGRQVSITLFGRDQIWHRHLTLKHYLSHTDEMFHYLYHQLYRSHCPSFPVIKFAVRLSLLKPVHQISLNLLPTWQKQEKLHLAIDHINQKHGLYTIHSGLLTNRHIIHPEVTGFFGDKQFHLQT